MKTISTLMSSSTGFASSPHPYSYHTGVGGGVLPDWLICCRFSAFFSTYTNGEASVHNT